MVEISRNYTITNMDLFDLLLQAGLVTTAIVAYLIFSRRSTLTKFKGNYREPGWNYLFRLLMARFAVRRWKSQRPWTYISDTTRVSQNEGWDCVIVRATGLDGSAVFISIRKLYDRPPLVEAVVDIKLPDGTTYRLPQHPDTIVGPWENVEMSWRAGGLKIEVLEREMRLRILYNGLLRRDEDEVTQHVRFNFLWTAASRVVKYPEDWSNQLAAQALALEPWRDGDWPSTLGKWTDGSWLQWGTVQGRFESYSAEGAVDKSVYLRTRGLRERSWAELGYTGMRRSVSLVATAQDGTAVQLRGFSYRDVLTIGYSGCVRFPDCRVESITGTDLNLAELCENPDCQDLPTVFTLSVSTKSRTLRLVVRTNDEGRKVLSGVPYQQQTLYRSVHVNIDGDTGTGFLELNYQFTEKSGPTVPLPQFSLCWAKETEVPEVGYCVPFEAPAAACPNYVGGKGASLALLASVQKQMGYRVPPGFCLTIKALEKHLEANPPLKAALDEIEAANVNYDENNFKTKCTKAVELFTATEIVTEVREEILSHLTELRKKALDENLGSELRFAVRSSAVGEDSEALSAAGQNETVLGCASDGDVIRGVQLCWESMFAFTSAYYRRQNGQKCLCGGGVVVQALVRARAAGVMFTRHPAQADPSRLLITANYGLGETVVSGTVEPDTIIVSRGKDLFISKIELGSKKQRARAEGDKVTLQDVTEEERKLPCITVSEALALAKIGVAQEQAWGAARDIEWAVTENEIFLLQARPITSVERWTEEELLHEYDTAIMSDEDLNTFANTGEVIPRPVTAITYDMMMLPLGAGIDRMFGTEPNNFDGGFTMTHCRVTFSLYNTVYRVVRDKIDLMIRMAELSMYGHKLMDDHILNVAIKRHPPSGIQAMLQMFYSFKYLLSTKACMNDAIELANNIKVNTDGDCPMTLLKSIEDQEPIVRQCVHDHSITSAGSSIAQFIAMMVLVEGGDDFSSEQCNEINTLLSSGGVVSADVPQALARIARKLDKSGKVDQFRAQEPKKALDWLKANLPDVYDEVSQFLEKHGHRAIMEFEFSTKPWVLVPEEMMEVVQHMRVNQEEKLGSKTDADVIAALKTPKKPLTRRILRWLLPLCQRTVRHRETTKAHLILIVHKLRLALRNLAQLMVKQWMLPDEELVFHFRLGELRHYLLTRDPALLRKASQRRQYISAWSKLKFPEMNTGWPEPLKSRGPIVTSGDVRLEATAVCGGEIVARACVIKDISQIDQLQRGDILITHCTDIGWSPYFPLLSGIVTELGGLISHGAVIAREYGLPCLVGAGDATDLFKTGDMVRLSATEGILEKVKVEET